jgi:hypothetical protein
MIVWGGTDWDFEFKTGGRYNPISDSWVTTRSTGPNVPSARSEHTAVWTGAEMIVWGGFENTGATTTGGRYSPATDSWTPTSTGANVPTLRYHNTSVWTGTEMIVWGGTNDSDASDLNTGGRYNPGTAVWTPTSTAGASVPSGRSQHTAVWTGTEMIVWGGYPRTATGGRYCACPGGRNVYLDADGDGYGNISMPSCDGSIPAGYAADAGDCDDAHASTHPGATEACNGVDDDCDAIVDNGGAVLCNDNDVCTNDACQGLMGCAHAFNTAPCDDGNPCTYFDTCSAGTCSSGPTGPPEIGGVSVTGHGPTSLNWTGLGGGASYDLSTSTLEELRANATTTATCLADEIPVASYVDTQPDPAENKGYYYLVRASDTCGTGSYGFDSAGAERIPTAACP